MLYCNKNHSAMDRIGFCSLKNKQVTDNECANCPVYHMDEDWREENKILRDKNAALNQRYSDLLTEFKKSLERTKELEIIEKKYNELINSFIIDLSKALSKTLIK